MQLILAVALALAAAPASGQGGGVIDFPPEARAEQDNFVVAILTTADFEAFGRAWIDGRGLQSTVTQRAARGEELVTVVLLQGCRPAADGKCNVTGRFTYLRPDGSDYGAIDLDIWKEAPRAGGYVFVGLGPTLVVDPPDPMGRWTLRAEVRDNVRGVTITVRTPIVVDTPPTAAAH